MTIAIVLLVAVAAVMLTLRDWRLGVASLIAWLLLEGTFRRLAPQTALVLFLFKDVLLLLLFLSYGVARARTEDALRSSVPWGALMAPLLLFFALAFVHVVNPKLPSFVVGIFGLKAHFLYVPLVLLGYHLFRSPERLMHGFSVFSRTAMITAAVALQQIFFPGRGFEDAQGGLYYHRLHSTESLDILLPTSIFAGELRFVSHALLCTFLSLGLLGSVYSRVPAERPAHLVRWAWIGFFVSLGTVFLTGKNLAIVLAGALVPSIAVAMLWSRRQRAIARFPWKRTVLAVAAVLISTTVAMPDRTKLVAEYFWFRITTGGLQEEGTRGVIRELASISSDKGLLGIGIGPFTQGIAAVAGLGGFTDPAAFRFHEGALPKTVVELGALGGVVWMWLAATIVALGFAATYRTRHPALRPLAIGIFAYLLAWMAYAWKSHAFFDDPFQQIPLWLMLGILLCIGYGPARRVTEPRASAPLGA